MRTAVENETARYSGHIFTRSSYNSFKDDCSARCEWIANEARSDVVTHIRIRLQAGLHHVHVEVQGRNKRSEESWSPVLEYKIDAWRERFTGWL